MSAPAEAATPSWGSPGSARQSRRQSANAGITFMAEEDCSTPPYILSPVSTTRRSSSEASGGLRPPPHDPRGFLARFQSNIQQLSVPETEVAVTCAPPAEAGTTLPAASPSPQHATTREAAAPVAPTSPLGSIHATIWTASITSPLGPATAAAVSMASASRRSSLHRAGPPAGVLQDPQGRRAAGPPTSGPAVATAPSSVMNSTAGSPLTSTSTTRLAGPPATARATLAASRTWLSPAPAVSSKTEMNAEVFSASLLPATRFLQHTARKQEEQQAEGVLGAEGGLVGAGGGAGLRRATRRSLAVSTDGNSTAAGKPVSAALTLLEQSGADDATALHRQRERNNYFIRKHMQNVEAARESQQELKSFERTLRQMEDRNTATVRRHRLHRKADRGAAGGSAEVSAMTRYGGDLSGQGDAANDYEGGDDDAFEDDEDALDDGDDEEATHHASNRAATDRTLREAAESWAAVQRLQVENPHITQTLQHEVRASQARLTSSRTNRVGTARNRAEAPDSDRTPSATFPPHASRHPRVMDEPAEINWGTEDQATTPGRASPPWTALTTTTSVSPPQTAGSLVDAPSPMRAPSSQTLVLADAVIDDYLGAAGAGLRNMGKPRGDGTIVRSMEEQLQVLLEYGNGASVYQGTQGGASGALPKLKAATKTKRKAVQRANSTSVVVVEAGTPLPAVSPIKATSSTPPPRGTSSPPIRVPPGPDNSHSHTHVDNNDNHDNNAISSLHAMVHGDEPPPALPLGKGQKRVTFSQPAPLGELPHIPSHPRASTTTAADTREEVGAESSSLVFASEVPPATAAASVGRGSTDATAPTTTAATEAAAAKSRKRFKRATKGHEPLPVALGVANRSAALLQHEMLTGRRRNLEMEVSKASDLTRSVKLLSQLHPLREELLRRDATNKYQTNPPETWETLYDTARGDSGPAQAGDTLPLLTCATPTMSTARADLDLATVKGAELPPWATPQQVLDAHQKIILGRAVTIDARDRREARLLYVDVLRVMCTERVPAELQPALLTTLAHARQLLAETPDQQNFTGFKAAVTTHIPNQQLVAWPVQEVLQHLATLFRVPNHLYKDWLGNVFVQLGNRHDYEARFRVVDRTIKNRELPQEANVRLTLHLCRRLPRVLMLPSATPVSPGRTNGAGGGLSAWVTPATAESPLSDGGDHRPKLDASTSTSLGLSDLAAFTRPDSNGVNPFSPMTSASSPNTATGAATGGGLSGPHEYAIRMQAERQTVTSSAVPAGAHAGANSMSPGREGSLATAAGGGAGAGPVGASKRTVNFADQTFKVHLYDTASQIRLTLLQDGQPIAEGRFTVQRYGNGRATQLWLPLQVCPGATLASGNSGADGRNTELKLTVEVLHDKHSTTTVS